MEVYAIESIIDNGMSSQVCSVNEIASVNPIDTRKQPTIQTSYCTFRVKDNKRMSKPSRISQAIASLRK